MFYRVTLSKQAKFDIEKVYDYIEQMLFAPLAAENFLRDIYHCIANLETHASIYAISMYQDVLRYGINARTVNYNGFTIIYTIHRRYVLVHRIIHGSLIKK
ncbi:MAG: type II toxin-antitoxin system RelE/ParE family toxin [Flavobacteriaceae bacterium]|nr:type II toxin-antitoxin system RelE/ParE family toxin [Flavobacteriaceae bacterium]